MTTEVKKEERERAARALKVLSHDNEAARFDVRAFIRDTAQEIACREAGEIARREAMLSMLEGFTGAATRYVDFALSTPRSSCSRHDWEWNFGDVKAVILEALAEILENTRHREPSSFGEPGSYARMTALRDFGHELFAKKETNQPINTAEMPEEDNF